MILDRGEGMEKEREHQCVIAFHTSPTGDLAGNPHMCTHWELNRQPFGLKASIQSTESHQPGPYLFIENRIYRNFQGLEMERRRI